MRPEETIRARMRRIEARATRLGLSKLAEDFACIRRASPVLYWDLSQAVLERMASDNRETARGGESWPYPPPSGWRERRLYSTIAAMRDGMARALDELLRLCGVVEVVRWIDDPATLGSCDGCNRDDFPIMAHAYITGEAGCTALCETCMEKCRAHAEARARAT